MSDDLEIRGGGAIAVDSSTLRETAAALEQGAATCAKVVDLVWQTVAAWHGSALRAPAVSRPAEDGRDEGRELAARLRQQAETYDAIEAAAVRCLTDAEREIVRAPLAEWERTRHAEIEAQLFGATGGFFGFGLMTRGFLAAVRDVDRGAIGAGDPLLRGTADPTTTRETSRSRVSAPASLEDIAARMPAEAEGQVRVEVYEYADGSRQYAAYIAGTQHLGIGTDNPWDMESNLQTYFGRNSASSAAVEQALVAAGAVRGDTVHLIGHSQGAMIATQLARSGEYVVPTVITFGSPVQGDLGDDTLQVDLRHTDDPVPALAAGGLPSVAGSRDSFIVERVVDPDISLGDLGFRTHDMSEYARTSALVDASDDSRVGALRTTLAGLGGAVAVTAVGYTATRDPATTEQAPRVRRGRRAPVRGGAWSGGEG